MHPQRNDSSYLFDWMERLVRSAGPDLFRLLERVEARLRMGDPLVPSGTGETERHGPGSDRHDVLLTVPEAAKPPRAERRERAIWTGTQAASFLRTTRDDDRYGALWAVAAGTGLRRAELIGLRWADVDPERGFLVVRRATTKTRAGARTLRLPSLAVAALRAHRVRQNARRLALGPGW